jgi:hypothetical protein
MTERREVPGELIDPVDDEGIDLEKDLIAVEDRSDDPTGVDRAPQDQGEVQPAEEAAMHITEEADEGGDVGD